MESQMTNIASPTKKHGGPKEILCGPIGQVLVGPPQIVIFNFNLRPFH